MDIFDQILESLELERELGTRTVEIDRALLVPPPAEPPPAEPKPDIASAKPVDRLAPSVPPPSPSTPLSDVARHPDAQLKVQACDVLFLTGCPLSAAGEEAVSKTIAAMKRIKAGVNVCIDENRSAKVIVLLGSEAVKKHAPNARRVVRDDWIMMNGVPAMVTFSPDYIFTHFEEGSPGMVAAKRTMWNDVKAALDRV